MILRVEFYHLDFCRTQLWTRLQAVRSSQPQILHSFPFHSELQSGYII